MDSWGINSLKFSQQTQGGDDCWVFRGVINSINAKTNFKNQRKFLNEKIQGKFNKIHLIKDTQKIQGNPGNIMEAGQEKRGLESGCLVYHRRWGEGLVLLRMSQTDNSALSTNFPVCRISVWLRSYTSIWLYACWLYAHMIIYSSHIYLIWPSHLIRIHLIWALSLNPSNSMGLEHLMYIHLKGAEGCCGILAGFIIHL